MHKCMYKNEDFCRNMTGALIFNVYLRQRVLYIVPPSGRCLVYQRVCRIISDVNIITSHTRISLSGLEKFV